MIAASRPVQRPADARLLVVDRSGGIRHAPRARFVEWLERGDLLVANDAATLPASLSGHHAPTGASIEVRLAGRPSLDPDDLSYSALVFGEGDFHIRTEDRPPPPPIEPGDRLMLGPLAATVERRLGHPRLVALVFDGPPSRFRAGLARHGHPIQYAHVPDRLHLWDVWTPIAGPPVAFEPPSAGFAIDWQGLEALRTRGIRFATITLAAGLSSTGDDDLDDRLPLDEPYRIPVATVQEIRRARERRGRVVAVGTTVVRALEHAARIGRGALHPGTGMATGRVGGATRLQVCDVILTGVHPPGTSHYRLLQAFAGDITLGRAMEEMERSGYREHEFGDSMLLERQEKASRPSGGRPVSAAQSNS